MKKNLFLLLILLVTFVTSTQPLFADSQAGKVFSVSGTAEVLDDGQGEWRKIRPLEELSYGDEIRTLGGAKVSITLTGGKIVRLRENSYLKLEPPKKQAKARLTLLEGAGYFFSRDGKGVSDIDTPQVSAAIRGSELTVEVKGEETTVNVLSGEIYVQNSLGAVELQSGEKSVTQKGKAPSKEVLVSPEDAVQWTLSISNVVDWSDLSKVVTPEVLGYLEARDFESARNASKEEAIGSLTHVVELLESGQVRLAEQSSLRRVEQERDAHFQALYYSVLTYAALALNESKASQYANKAVQVDSSSKTAQAALARVLSSEGKHSEALHILQNLESSQPSFRFRLVEAALANDDLGLAERELTKLRGMSQSSSDLDLFEGFIALQKNEVSRAQAKFQDALQQSSDNDKAYFGLGLSLIASGNGEEGRRSIERAVTLQPTRSVYRSYLGKALFETEQEALALEEYKLALTLDPNDPTPHLYRAFTHLSRNQPVHALVDLEESISKNDTRSVYRSRLGLDEDRAVRTASLGETYLRLGFERIAQLQAMKSLSFDYSNFSAHRLLGETLVDPLSSDGRFTESILADILSPVSFNVFQNQRGFRSDAGFNEYSALFERDETRVGVSGSVRTAEDLATGSAFQTGKFGNFGYYLGYQGEYGDGRKRGGIFSRDNRLDLATQYQIDKNNRVVLSGGFEGRRISLPGDESSLDDGDVSVSSFHNLTKNFTLLNRVEYFNRTIDENAQPVPATIFEDLKRDGVSEALTERDLALQQMTEEALDTMRYNSQLIFQGEGFSIVTGGQWVDTNNRAHEESDVLLTILDEEMASEIEDSREEFTSNGRNQMDSYSAYTYLNYNFESLATLSTGLNYSRTELPNYDVLAPFRDGTHAKDKLSPKVGLSLYPSESVTVRTAYFQSLGVSNVSDIGSLEPTVLGSFSQSYADLPGTESENYGIGVDYRNPANWYAGIEYLRRDLERTFESASRKTIFDLDSLREDFMLTPTRGEESSSEDRLRSYLYFVLNDASTLSLDYYRRELSSVYSDLYSGDMDDVIVTHRYFSPNRWFTTSRVGWHQGHGVDTDLVSDEDSEALLLDLGIGYRLRNRHGSIQLSVFNLLDEEFSSPSVSDNLFASSGVGAGLSFAVNF